jgi:negative regulator of genetic competence, sporulation and motility
MELIRISDSKLKIILNETDMQRYALSSDALSYENCETRRAVREVLAEAEEETGFHATADRLLIQAYPSRDGGCELYVTKIETPATEEKKKTYTPPPKEGKGRLVIYTLPALSALLAVCRQLSVTGYCDYSAAYTGEGDTCYLVLREGTRTSAYPLSAPLYHPAEEYGEKETAAGKLAYIKEHARCIYEGDAVGTLAPLA